MESIKRRSPRKMTQKLLESINQMIDRVFFDGENLTYDDIAKANGISERYVHTLFERRFKHNQKILLEQKKKQVIAKQNEDVEIFQSITIVGRKELINGKVCHVYPSRMNYENA